MAPMRRRDPEPPPGPPRIEFRPGMADEMLRELAPLLAEEGIDVNDIQVDDIETLQRAMNRAVERQNMALFHPSRRKARRGGGRVAAGGGGTRRR